jgi:hypothetical protein
MKTRAIGLLTSILMGFGVLIGFAPPAQAVDCFIDSDYDSAVFELGLHRDVFVSTKVLYKHCLGVHGKRWIRPISYKVKWDMEGRRRYLCSPIAAFQGVFWDAVFQDNAGHKENPRRFKQRCQTDTNGEWTRSLRESPRLFYCQGPPTWVNKAEIDVRGWRNPTKTLGGTMWGFTGPSRNCPGSRVLVLN